MTPLQGTVPFLESRLSCVSDRVNDRAAILIDKTP